MQRSSRLPFAKSSRERVSRICGASEFEAGLITNSPGFSLCCFGSISNYRILENPRISANFAYSGEILSFAKRTSAGGFLGGVGFRDKHDLSGGAQWRARRAFEHFSARLEYGKEINQSVGRNQ